MNVKLISGISDRVSGARYPAVVIHGLADARTALAVGAPVTLLSGLGAALYAGSLWWFTLTTRVRTEYGDVPIDDVLDCADASGLALGALRVGVRRLVLWSDSPGFQSVTAIAASLNGEIFSIRPPALDLAARDASRGLREWLLARDGQSDSHDRLS